MGPLILGAIDPLFAGLKLPPNFFAKSPKFYDLSTNFGGTKCAVMRYGDANIVHVCSHAAPGDGPCGPAGAGAWAA